MPEDRTPETQPRVRIDLMRAADVAYWCRVFGTSTSELRHAVQHAGPQVQAVRRYLEEHPVTPS